MKFALITAPTLEPITLAEARSHLHLDDSDGEPAPTELTAALAGDGVGNVDDGIHRYKVTFVTADGETEGGTASDALTVADKSTNGIVDLSGIQVGGAGVTARKIYRTVAGGSTYKLLATISDNVTVIYEDNIADASLGADAPTTNNTLDPYITGLIKASRKYAEAYTRRAFITQTWELLLDRFPGSRNRGIELPKAAAQSITYIKYTDTSGTLTTWSSDEYTLFETATPGYIKPAYGYNWPSARNVDGAVVIRFVCGYGAAASSVDADVLQAIKILIAHWYENRDLVNHSGMPSKIPLSVDALLDTQRVFNF